MKAAVDFLASDVDTVKHRSAAMTPSVELKAVGAVLFDGYSGLGGKSG
ncbi:MAG: hypothetical protein ABFD82_09375 [Syntrophaceae bacterium]